MWGYLESLYTQFSGKVRKSNSSEIFSFKILQHLSNIFLYFDIIPYNIHRCKGNEDKIDLKRKRESVETEDYLNTQNNIL